MARSRGFALAVLRGIGQIIFQANAATGALFLLAVGIHSWTAASALLGGAVVGTLAAHLLRCPRDGIRDGLYGFNGALVGVGGVFFFAPSLETAALIAVGAVASVAVMRLMQRLPLPPYTAPFVLVTWGLWLAGRSVDLPPAVQPAAVTGSGHLAGALAGLGQVMFQESVISGTLILAGMVVGARWAGLCTLGGSLVGGIAGLALGGGPVALTAGLLGYNASLAAVAMAGKRPRVLAPALAAMLTIPFPLGFWRLGLPALTAPFVLASWCSAGLLRGLFPRR